MIHIRMNSSESLRCAKKNNFVKVKALCYKPEDCGFNTR
jgi:hypothetical protein